ncbi:hypothetical protein NQ317_012748 [Molorchus minor]|uniref:Uncharacterized protein n=1 Tax=Molorchus minor TaxID=1323400 RepID=A0ABQ9K247_9CUCU|nr:hypothetical protein NQ317_012748 [Molorchus minor]
MSKNISLEIYGIRKEHLCMNNMPYRETLTISIATDYLCLSIYGKVPKEFFSCVSKKINRKVGKTYQTVFFLTNYVGDLTRNNAW